MWQKVRDSKLTVVLCVCAILLGGVLCWFALRPSTTDAKKGEPKYFLYKDAQQQQQAELDK